jgi:hypothetical protein
MKSCNSAISGTLDGQEASSLEAVGPEAINMVHQNQICRLSMVEHQTHTSNIFTHFLHA